MKPPRWPSPRTILGHTLLLTIGVVLAVAGVTVALILIMQPPVIAPVSALELARLLSDRPVAHRDTGVETRLARHLPASPEKPPAASTPLIRSFLARKLGRSSDEVYFTTSTFDLPFGGSEAMTRLSPQAVEREHRLYGPDGEFNPYLFGSFTAALKLDDGSWRIVSRGSSDPLGQWQVAMIRWILFTVLLLAPIAWLFSRRLAEPIRAFAAAAEGLGRHKQAALVAVRGPTEIRLAAEALNEMQARLEHHVTERTSMIGAIAHDLRTPLARLAFHLHAAPKELRLKAEAEVGEMERMISTVLDFVQNEERVQEQERLDLRLLVEGVVDDLADAGYEARLSEGVPVDVIGDHFLLRRLFANLITNAVTYGKRASVGVFIRGERAVVEVGDDGPGLSPEEIRRAFEPFFRAEGSRNRATGGIGLGLAIVQAAARSHGGDVQLSNRPEGGLCARVTLPMVR